MTESNKSTFKSTGFLIPGCMFIGMGAGFLMDDVKIGLFLGMGVGFLLAGILSVKKAKN